MELTISRRKVQVLQGCGKDELLKIMDYESLPHFCKRQSSGSSKNSSNNLTNNCFSLDLTNHQRLCNYEMHQAAQFERGAPLRQGSVHVKFPESDLKCTEIAVAIKSEINKSKGKTEMD